LLLGLLPKAEQLALLRGSLGLIQPTRFEGGPGGGSVREAMALGTRILISDIPVNREIPSDLGWLRYFPPGDADRLAVLMADLTTAGDVRPANGDLLRVGRERMRGLSQVLHGAIDLAAGRKL
jgi:glycosyltransferase involved in cell wall biosynthesis